MVMPMESTVAGSAAQVVAHSDMRKLSHSATPHDEYKSKISTSPMDTRPETKNK